MSNKQYRKENFESRDEERTARLEKQKLYYKKNRENILDRNKAQVRSLKGRIGRMYRAANRRNIARGYDSLPFGLDDFIKWIEVKNYEKLHRLWVESNYAKKLSPSIDRIDNTKGYSLGNIRIISTQENSLEFGRKVKNGEWGFEKNTPVVRISSNGDRKKYISLRSASRENGVSHSSISKACREIYKTSGGFKWEYENEKLS